MKLIDSETYINLATAYAGECQARTRYEFIEYGARIQEYKQLALIIDRIVYNEFNHARMFYTALQDGNSEQIKNIDISGGFPFKEKWDLLENLRLGAEDEKAEVILYPKFARIAEKEGFKNISNLFLNIANVEKKHQKIFEYLHKKLSSETLYKSQTNTKWVCADCGYEMTGKEAFKTCPVCKAKQGSVLIDLKIKI